jgi:DNA-binding Xre family transcriptional regulator
MEECHIVKITSNLKNLLKERHPDMSLRQFAEVINEDREKVRRFAANDFRKLSVELVEKLCEYFDCGIEELLIVNKVVKKDKKEK